ncbi:hypothetical protein BKA80DRAFT_265197 [Phyllosticta citrichinensis]
MPATHPPAARPCTTSLPVLKPQSVRLSLRSRRQEPSTAPGRRSWTYPISLRAYRGICEEDRSFMQDKRTYRANPFPFPQTQVRTLGHSCRALSDSDLKHRPRTICTASYLTRMNSMLFNSLVLLIMSRTMCAPNLLKDSPTVSSVAGLTPCPPLLEARQKRV